MNLDTMIGTVLGMLMATQMCVCARDKAATYTLGSEDPCANLSPFERMTPICDGVNYWLCREACPGEQPDWNNAWCKSREDEEG